MLIVFTRLLDREDIGWLGNMLRESTVLRQAQLLESTIGARTQHKQNERVHTQLTTEQEQALRSDCDSVYAVPVSTLQELCSSSLPLSESP